MPWEEVPLEAAPAPPDVEAWAATLPQETGHASPPWEDDQAAPAQEQEQEQPARRGRDFPLDAFIIPEDSRSIPAGVEISEELQRQIAGEVADSLDALAARLRVDGLGALLAPSTGHEPVDIVLAAVISGYIARKAH